MDHRWFKGLREDQKQARHKELARFRPAFEELKTLLENEFEDRAPDYKSPSWSHEQADRNGANRKLRSILKLLEID